MLEWLSIDYHLGDYFNKIKQFNTALVNLDHSTNE